MQIERTTERWAEGPTVLQSIWRFRWLVLGVGLLSGLIGFMTTSNQVATYQAQARVHLADPGSSDVFGRTGGVDISRYTPQQAERLTSNAVLSAAADELSEDITAAYLRRQIDVDSDVDLGTLTIYAQDPDPVRAAQMSNVVAGAYEENVRTAQLARVEEATTELERAESEIQERIDELSQGLNPLEPDTTGERQIGILAQQLVEVDALAQQLRVDAHLFGSGVEFFEQAEPPSAPIAPQPRRAAAASGILGLLAAAALAYWLAGRSERVIGQDDPSEILGVPLLGILPLYHVRNAASLHERTQIDPRTSEAYRFAYSSLRQVLLQHGARSVLVTSASPGAGKTETALQLAITASERESRVLLIDADVRIRQLTTFLHSEREAGLLDLGLPHPPAPLSLVRRYPTDEDQELAIVTAGEVRGRGPAQVQEHWFGRALETLSEPYEIIVLDSPPLLAVADTATMAAYVDAVVLVVREGSSREQLERVHQRMRFVGQRLVGYVYLTPNALDNAAFGYGLVRAQSHRRRRGPRVGGPTWRSASEADTPDASRTSLDPTDRAPSVPDSARASHTKPANGTVAADGDRSPHAPDRDTGQMTP